MNSRPARDRLRSSGGRGRKRVVDVPPAIACEECAVALGERGDGQQRIDAKRARDDRPVHDVQTRRARRRPSCRRYTCPLWLTTPSAASSAIGQPPRGCTVTRPCPNSRLQTGFLTKMPPSALVGGLELLVDLARTPDACPRQASRRADGRRRGAAGRRSRRGSSRGTSACAPARRRRSRSSAAARLRQPRVARCRRSPTSSARQLPHLRAMANGASSKRRRARRHAAFLDDESFLHVVESPHVDDAGDAGPDRRPCRRMASVPR